jgi:hypothetical protein
MQGQLEITRARMLMLALLGPANRQPPLCFEYPNAIATERAKGGVGKTEGFGWDH